MNEQLEQRLKALEAEFHAGKQMLAELETREATLRASLLRITGAIQVLREFLPQSGSSGPGQVPAEAGENLAAAG
jgi:hypothetical protein